MLNVKGMEKKEEKKDKNSIWKPVFCSGGDHG